MKVRPGRIALLFGSLLVSLVASELVLRFAFPRYAHVTDGASRRDGTRIWSRPPDVVKLGSHPDSGSSHLVIYNNLGLRQHRDLSPGRRPGEIRVGLFGDSFAENLRIPAPHMISEVLDFLLNLHAGDFSVLNFGVGGYGTDQSYLTFRDAPATAELDQAIYLFCWNDVMDLYQSGLFELGSEGELVARRVRETPWWKRALSRLHLTYLVLDFGNRMDATAASRLRDPFEREWHRSVRERRRDATSQRIGEALQQGRWREYAGYVALLRAILEAWQREATLRGTEFHVAIVPSTWDADYAALLEGYAPIDLKTALAKHSTGLGWRFEKDAHWNELGNQLAAVQLLRVLERSLGLEPLPDRRVAEELYVYYDAFDEPWRPDDGVRTLRLDDARRRRIRERYVPLEAGARARLP